MAIECFEVPTSRPSEFDGNNEIVSQIRRYTVQGTASEEAAFVAAMAFVPADLYGGDLERAGTSLDPVYVDEDTPARGLWEVVVRFERPDEDKEDEEKRPPNRLQYTFTTQMVNRKTALKQIALAGVMPKEIGLKVNLRVEDGKVKDEGVEVPVGIFNIMLTRFYPRAKYQTILDKVDALAVAVNSAAVELSGNVPRSRRRGKQAMSGVFRCAKHEALFCSCSAVRDDGSAWFEVDLQFLRVRSGTVRAGELVGQSVGHDYIWTPTEITKETVDGVEDIKEKPVAILSAEMLAEADFGPLLSE